jgi:hypothetical protein
LKSTSRHIIFIAYLFEPDKTVGSKRMTYWAKNWKTIHPLDKVTVFTNTVFESKAYGTDFQYYIPTSHSTSLLSKAIKDEGINWSEPIKDFTKKNNISADFVLISGAPFMHFSIQTFFQNRGAKTIVDYRDPFASNPRFGNSKVKVAIKKYFENKFNRKANAILTVNDYCLHLLAGYNSEDARYTVIKNGYDDSTTRSKEDILQNKLEVNFIYGGTFFEDRSALPLLMVLNKEKHKLHHIGAKNEFSKRLENNENYCPYGLRLYDELMKGLFESDVCVLFSSGKAFESTTKVYDYIAANKTIWIISNTKVSSGALFEELKMYPKVLFSKNDVNSLKNDLPKVLEIINDSINYNPESFSRRNGLEKLSQLIETL